MVPRPRDSSQALTWEKWRRPWKPRLAESGDGCAAFSTRWREASMRSALVLAQLPHSRNTQPGLCALTASISASLTLCQPSLPWYAGLVLFHGEHAVEQEHALLRPMAQVAAIGHAATQVRRQFLVQIAQAGRHSHAGRHRERQSHRLAVAVIGSWPRITTRTSAGAVKVSALKVCAAGGNMVLPCCCWACSSRSMAANCRCISGVDNTCSQAGWMRAMAGTGRTMLA